MARYKKFQMMSSLSWYKILILGEAKLICLSTGPTDPILSKSKNIILQSFSLSIISKFSDFLQKKKKKQVKESWVKSRVLLTRLRWHVDYVNVRKVKRHDDVTHFFISIVLLWIIMSFFYFGQLNKCLVLSDNTLMPFKC